MDGAIVIDKPEDWTSHDVVNKIRRVARLKKVGHLGTLDPIATGVLPLVVGRATRLAQFYTRNDKVYEAVVRFGFATDTYDRAGRADWGPDTTPEIRREELESRLEAFRGEFLQTPPPVSAKKVDGVRAYKLARLAVAVELEPVSVRVYELTLLGVEGRDVTLAGALFGRVLHALAGPRSREGDGLRRAPPLAAAHRFRRFPPGEGNHGPGG